MEETENENENENSREMNPSISMKISSHAPADHSLSSDPLFSSILTLYILILLYFPQFFSKLIFSPVLWITLILLLTLLRFGATERNENRENSQDSESNCTTQAAEISAGSCSFLERDLKWASCTETGLDPNPCFEDSFVEWNVKAPLEVIYEAYEGEEEEEEKVNKDPNNYEKDPGNNKDPSRFWIERYSSLSLYYPETDSDTSSDGGDFLTIADRGSPESACFKWEDEDREGLIEIALDHGANDDNNKIGSFDFENFHGEEENNLIEIDISTVKNEEKWRFSGES